MRINFQITDELTITNTTVKITATIRGTINGETRDLLEARALRVAKELFPNAQWAFSNFQFNPDGLTFTVGASTRVETDDDDQLDERAKMISSNSDTKIAVSRPDYSIPLFDIRAGESQLRMRMIEMAEKEAAAINAYVDEITFQPSGGGMALMKSASYASAVAADGPAALGHSEKITLTASVAALTRDRITRRA